MADSNDTKCGKVSYDLYNGQRRHICDRDADHKGKHRCRGTGYQWMS